MKLKLTSVFKATLVIFLTTLTFSCVPTKKLSYFTDINEIEEPVANPKIQKQIMPFDRLYIRVLSTDANTRQIFNFTEDTRYDQSGAIMGYLVDDKGNINFPFVGSINVGNLTTAQASAKIQAALNDYVVNTSIVVKIVDSKVSLLGEVQNQGTFSFSQEKLTIYEALALGGGMTRYGNRKNVILIRQEGDKIMHHKLNLSDSKIASNDYYYILPNDIIVVEPLKSVSTSYANNTFSLLLSSVTTLTSLITMVVYIYGH
jgi:polysaccharide export outer membrane protein